MDLIVFRANHLLHIEESPSSPTPSLSLMLSPFLSPGTESLYYKTTLPPSISSVTSFFTSRIRPNSIIYHPFCLFFTKNVIPVHCPRWYPVTPISVYSNQNSGLPVALQASIFFPIPPSSRDSVRLSALFFTPLPPHKWTSAPFLVPPFSFPRHKTNNCSPVFLVSSYSSPSGFLSDHPDMIFFWNPHLVEIFFFQFNTSLYRGADPPFATLPLSVFLGLHSDSFNHFFCSSFFFFLLPLVKSLS